MHLAAGLCLVPQWSSTRSTNLHPLFAGHACSLKYWLTDWLTIAAYMIYVNCKMQNYTPSIANNNKHCVQKNNTRFCFLAWLLEQELSCRKQIARRLRTQYVEGTVIYRPKYYTVTLKSRLKVTQGHWKRNNWIDHTGLTIVELFDVEHYRDLEMWVRGHSRSLKMVHLKACVRFPIRLP